MLFDVVMFWQIEEEAKTKSSEMIEREKVARELVEELQADGQKIDVFLLSEVASLPVPTVRAMVDPEYRKELEKCEAIKRQKILAELRKREEGIKRLLEMVEQNKQKGRGVSEK